jgi:DNA mismatch repair protein MutS
MAEELPHLCVYTMAISDDEQGEVVFLHRVTPGSIGRSYGVHVAKLAGMPLSIVRRAEEVLKRLESAKDSISVHTLIALNGNDVSINGHNELMVADGNGHYNAGMRSIGLKSEYEWQTEEARLAAQNLERTVGTLTDLDVIDISAITPLDALNLLFIMQKKRKP